MKYMKSLAVGFLVALALFGAWTLYGSVQNLYGDWVFVRQLRVAAIQRQAQQRQEVTSRPSGPSAVTPASSAAVTP